MRKAFLVLAIVATLAGIAAVGYGVWLVTGGFEAPDSGYVRGPAELPSVTDIDGMGAIGIGGFVAFCGGLTVVSLCRKRTC